MTLQQAHGVLMIFVLIVRNFSELKTCLKPALVAAETTPKAKTIV